uniref:PiggyBac transposable element-derived protein domain-containing protein n=1 Tax=Octopus bimaculoides TaxID=37653 RepID=A0A0L8FU40_OCTBM
MIPTKNSLSIKQYIKDKLIKWGIKTFLVCNSENGYISNAEVYTGHREDAETIEKLGVIGNFVVFIIVVAIIWCDKKPIYFLIFAFITHTPVQVQRHDSKEHRKLPVFFIWATYNVYVIMGHYKLHNPQEQRVFTFHAFVEKLYHGLVGNYHRLLPMKIHPNTDKHLQDYGLYKVERAPHATSNNRYVVCLEKHNRAKQQNPSATYKDLKKSKTVYWCNYCKDFLCIGVPQQN